MLTALFLVFLVVLFKKKKKKSCRELSLDSIADSLSFSLCLGESILCARKGSILSPGRVGMLSLKDGIDMATELTQILLKMPGTCTDSRA